ncbi:MAG: mandelate racemase [Candidatus Latescibacteria bacterium]|nr:mandelate racemase [Candidatus Latescibacterota bacterium]
MHSAPRLALHQTHFFLRNVRTRMPFRYGVATLTSVPILHLVAELEVEGSGQATGVAADILPPKWFDKDPAKRYQDNVDDLLWAANRAAVLFAALSRQPRSLFALWREASAALLAEGDQRGLNHLTSNHGVSLLERALIDGLGKALKQSYHTLLKHNALGVDLGQLHPELRGIEPSQCIAPQPLGALYIRHTVGLADPIRSAEIPAAERLDDGLPQSLEEYLQTQQLSYFKIKVSGVLEADLERLRAIATLLDSAGTEYHLSLDGNEQYKEMEGFLELVHRIETDPALARFWASTLYIEQPLERSLALEPALAAGIRATSTRKPLLIDESDGDLDSFRRAIDLGYLGVSAKNCKGLIKAVANQGLGRHFSASLGRPFFLTGEDLMNLPVVPLQQDLAQLAALGVTHAERNGHHYVRGLDHLSSAERQACTRVHPALYAPLGHSLALDIRQGRIDLSSLQCPGLGVGMEVDTASMIPLEDWRFESLA